MRFVFAVAGVLSTLGAMACTPSAMAPDEGAKPTPDAAVSPPTSTIRKDTAPPATGTKKDAAVDDPPAQPPPADAAAPPAADAAKPVGPADTAEPPKPMDAAPMMSGDGEFDLTITGTSKTFRMSVLPLLIQRCGNKSCHGDVLKDPMGPSGNVANADEIRALQWLRGKTKCDKATTKEKAYVNPERATNKDLFDDTVGAAKSYIWKKLQNSTADICGSPMPKPEGNQAWKKLSGDDKTPNTDLFIIFDWIAHGAG